LIGQNRHDRIAGVLGAALEVCAHDLDRRDIACADELGEPRRR
jgi:hypothetical protein